MHATDAKLQKNKPDSIFLWWTNVSEAVYKRDWQREVVFIFLRAKMSDSVCNDLQCVMTFRLKKFRTLH